jgi:hypothetical protein
MGSTAKHLVILIISLAIGIGVTFFSTSLIEPMFPIDQLTQIILAVVLAIFAYIAFYYMTKGSG